jgi:hypothetical protein
VGLSRSKICSSIRSVKDDVELRTPRVYSKPCECGIVYIAKTDTTLKKHHREYQDTSAVTEHSVNLGHNIQLQHTANLSNKPKYIDPILRETTEIEPHPNYMKWEDGFCQSMSWKFSSAT